MDAKKFLIGTLAGTVTSFIVAYLLYGMLLHSYMASNSMEGVGKETPDFLWVVLGHIFFSAGVTYIFLKWAGIKTIAAGATGGFIIGLLFSLGWDFTMLGTSNIMTGGVTMAVVDAIAGGIIWAAGGAGVGWALGLGKE
jgi:hypothetical protein